MKLIDLFAMPAKTAVMEAAATGQIDWIKDLFPRVKGQVDVVARKVTDLAATFGHSNVILATYKWRKATSNTAWVAADYAQSKAAAGGHFDALERLASLYGVSSLEPLKLAVDRGYREIVRLLCEKMESEIIFLGSRERPT